MDLNKEHAKLGLSSLEEMVTPAVRIETDNLLAAQKRIGLRTSAVDHPSHYGGADNVYEAIKVIDAWNLNFCLGNVLKYLLRADKKSNTIEDLEKAKWYLNHEIERLKAMEKT